MRKCSQTQKLTPLHILKVLSVVLIIIMVLQLPGIENLFPHSKETQTGGGMERIGQATIIVSLDGTGDTDSIQEAVDMLPADGGEIFIKEGTYDITSPILIDQYWVTITGTGHGTILRNKLSGGDTVLMEVAGTSDVEYFRISKIYFDISDDNGNAGVTGIRGGDGGAFENSFIQDCAFFRGTNDTGSAIYLDTAQDIIVTENTFWKGQYGIDTTDTSASIFADNHFRHMSKKGIRCIDMVDSIIKGNFIDGTGAGTAEDGIFLDGGGAGSGADNNVVGDNRIKDFTDGIEIQDNTCDKNIVTSNNCVGCTNALNDAGTNTSSNNNIN